MKNEPIKSGNILIVDDNKIDIEVILQALENRYNIYYALNTSLAFEILKKNSIDLILLDIMMPDMNGFDFCNLLKKDDFLKNISVIFLTVKDNIEYVVKGFEAGAVDYITKPFEIRELNARVNTHLELYKAKKIIKNQNDMLEQIVVERTQKLHDMMKLLEKENSDLKYNLYTDELTGLPNEKKLLKDIKNKDRFIFYFLNINFFREINQNFGYETGDALLQKIAERLKKSNLLSYKSDNYDFILIEFEELNDQEIKIRAQLYFELLCNDVYLCNDHEIHLTASIGITKYSQTTITNEWKIFKKLISEAGYALKYAKEKKLMYYLFDQKLAYKKDIRENYRWINIIKNAINNKLIRNFYQPVIDNTTLKIKGYEALIRIKNEKEIFLPDSFLEAAKKYRLYNKLTQTVFFNSLKKIDVLDTEISVNISNSDIVDDSTRNFIIESLSIFKKSDKLVFELLESEGIENYDEVKDFIREVKKYGCKIAIDDFGSGYSNFDYLMKLDIDYIKIDSSIIKNITIDKNSEIIAETIAKFAQKLNIQTIAEHVHNKDIYDKVKSLNITYSQGYYFSEPIEFL